MAITDTPISVVDGSDVTQGTTTDALKLAGQPGTLIGKVSGILMFLCNLVTIVDLLTDIRMEIRIQNQLLIEGLNMKSDLDQYRKDIFYTQ